MKMNAPSQNGQARRWTQRLGISLLLVACTQVALAQGDVSAASNAAAKTTATLPTTQATQAQTSKSIVKTIHVVGYNRAIKQEHFKGLSKDVVLKMQKQLEAIYQNLPDWKQDYALKNEPLNDGIVGPITLHWLQRFGYNFKVVAEGGYAPTMMNLIDAIAHFGEVHAPELAILLSTDFDAWDALQEAKVKNQDFAIRRLGVDKDLMELVNRYRASRKPKPRAAPAKDVDDSAYFTYRIDQADLDVMGGKDQIVQMLATLKDKEFSSSEALRVGLAQVMSGRSAIVKQIWPLLEAHAQYFDGHLLNEAALEAVKKQADFPPEVIAKLQTLGTHYFKTRELFDAYLDDNLNTESLFITDDERKKLVAATQVFDNVHLTEAGLATIKKELEGNIQNKGVPAAVVRMLGGIKDVNYPELSLFRSAAIAKIAMGIGACKMNSPSNNAYVGGLRLNDEDFSLFQEEMKSISAQPADGKNTMSRSLDEALGELKRQRLMISICDKKTVQESRDLITQIYQTYLAVAIEQVAKKRIPDEITPIRLKGESCGCARDDFSGVVIGFYPYWNNQKTAQAINFEVLNRVAYYGLSFDNVGELFLGAQSFDVESKNIDEHQFVRLAHQYNSKVDWVIQKNDWRGDWSKFSRENKRSVLKKLISNLATLLRHPLSDTYSRIKPYVSFGMSKQPTRGDGITLYFQNYPEDVDSALIFNEFYLALRKEFEEDEVQVNLMVAQDTLLAENKTAAFSLPNLVKLHKKSDQQSKLSLFASKKLTEYLLVLVNEPSSDAKKQLRLDVENERGLHGADRAEFLRSMVPVLTFDQRNWQQFEDDIVYASDNFGGLGLWAPDFANLALPLGNLQQSCAQSKQLAVCILKGYREAKHAEKVSSDLAKWVCVNRAVLQLIMSLFLVSAIVIALLAYRYCFVQNWVKRYFLWILCGNVVPPLVIFILLLLFDPYLSALSQGNIPFIATAVLSLLGLFFGYRYLRSLHEVPQRQGALPQRNGLGLPLIKWAFEVKENELQWVIHNHGNGVATIKKVQITIDGQFAADAQAAFEMIIKPNPQLRWKSQSLVGKRIAPGENLIALDLHDQESKLLFAQLIKKHDIHMHIHYCSAHNEQWMSDGKEITLVPTEV